MKKFVLFLLCAAPAIFAFAQTDAIKQYVNTYNEIAIKEMLRTGVPAAITLAQGIVESQAGQSDLVKSSNNHFGIKCKDEWTGDCVYHDDDLKNECFRVYGSAEESFRDHSDFLKNRPYYTDLFNIDPANYKAWAKGLKKAGYATERDYPQMLVKMIEANGLQQYTLLAMDRMKNGSNLASVAEYNEGDSLQVPSATELTAENTNDSKTETSKTDEHNAVDKQQAAYQVPAVLVGEKLALANDDGSYPEGEFTINHRKVIYARAGTSLLSIATKYDITLASVLNYNEISKKEVLKEDRLIFLEKKLAKGEKEYHIATRKETMEDIAQIEGVRLESLLAYNNVKKGVNPGAGKKIYLRPVATKSAKLAKNTKRAKLAKTSQVAQRTKGKKHKLHAA